MCCKYESMMLICEKHKAYFFIQLDYITRRTSISDIQKNKKQTKKKQLTTKPPKNKNARKTKKKQTSENQT